MCQKEPPPPGIYVYVFRNVSKGTPPPAYSYMYSEICLGGKCVDGGDKCVGGEEKKMFS